MQAEKAHAHTDLAVRGEAATPAPTGEMLAQAMDLIRGMAEAIQRMQRKIDRLEGEMHKAVPVTRAQARALQEMIAARAGEICGTYRLPGQEKRIGAAIRRDLRTSEGVRSVQDIPRVDYEVSRERIALWDDYYVIREARHAIR